MQSVVFFASQRFRPMQGLEPIIVLSQLEQTDRDLIFLDAHLALLDVDPALQFGHPEAPVLAIKIEDPEIHTSLLIFDHDLVLGMLLDAWKLENEPIRVRGEDFK